MSEFDILVSSLNADITRATDMMIVGKRSLVCLSVVLVGVCCSQYVTHSAPCRRALKVSRWWPLRSCLTHFCFLNV